MASSDRPSQPPDHLHLGSSHAAAPNSPADQSVPSQPPVKAVCFPDESTSPNMVNKNKDVDQPDQPDPDKSAKQYTASVGRKRLSGRLSTEGLSLHKQKLTDSNPSLPSLLPESSPEALTHSHSAHENLLKQIGTWLKRERNRRHARRAKRKSLKHETHEQDDHGATRDSESTGLDEPDGSRDRRGSESSEEGSAALDQLAHILESALSIKPAEAKKRIPHLRKASGGLKRHSAISTDSDYFESIDQLVPSCDAVLDNSKTLSYCVDEPKLDSAHEDSESRAFKEQEAWSKFRFEILRIAHTLKLKGWRKVPMEQSNEISVQRLSGALTNAVYVVAPPKNLFTSGSSDGRTPKPTNPPPKLLLRIYGPQVEHLIDRESELQILSRLARKRIGPCLLGTFQNGRFEEFLNAKALTASELRIPETSLQIAKRMRELHEGIDLLNDERKAGPFVWQNWDKWVGRCEQIVPWLDQQFIENTRNPNQAGSVKWKTMGFVCGVEWSIFRSTVEKYRAWLEKQYGGIDKINQRMVFAHNDTQYGNILRMEPERESPLLLPANQHKQLVVIDFEYANANLPGLEFANHFTEWAYNYHDEEAPWRCRHQYYPNSEEQHRFIRAYLMHNPTYKAAGGYTSNPMTPNLISTPPSGIACAAAATAAPSKISEFMLDSRAPPGEKYQEQEAQAEKQTEDETVRLMAETKLWRFANSAMWVAWGIVQAQVPGMPDFESGKKGSSNEVVEQADAEKKVDEGHATGNQDDVQKKGDGTTPETQDAIPDPSSDEEEFDYLSYAKDRAMFLWGDAIQLGIVKAEELPEELRQKVKIVEY